MKGEDMRMGEPSGDLDLAQEALGPDGGSKLRAQDLERNGPVMANVVGEIDRRHSPAAEFALDRVTPGEGDLKAGQLVCHGCSGGQRIRTSKGRSEEHTSELQSQSNLVCRLLLEKKKKKHKTSLRDHDCRT